ncbi:unnamed protein product [Euphydryas editha]|uniref:Peptidase S1 domain-containing protein n=1 Tax=Euphydryas editha TaxID=104508 RepID=A0AAU9UQE0_EUPED|nr:unnamed protein product [Euphydryas editha]
MIFTHATVPFLLLVFNKEIEKVLSSYSDWQRIETLAEEYPYIVAILNHEKDYVCTGTVINKRTVLTSGRCINPVPHYVTTGTAVFWKNQSSNNVFEVAFTKLHGDYIFNFHERDLSISQMHSNIGLIFTVKPFLDLYLESANIGNYFASELKGKKLLMVGYGNIKEPEVIVLQQQTYHQVPCKNPKWYYCICGIEYSAINYEEPFGEGAPVLYNDVVVGISASPSGSLTQNRNINYNIFTVIGPYLPWIEKSKSSIVLQLKNLSNSVSQSKTYEKRFIFITIAITMLNKLIH